MFEDNLGCSLGTSRSFLWIVRVCVRRWWHSSLPLWSYLSLVALDMISALTSRPVHGALRAMSGDSHHWPSPSLFDVGQVWRGPNWPHQAPGPWSSWWPHHPRWSRQALGAWRSYRCERWEWEMEKQDRNIWTLNVPQQILFQFYFFRLIA